MSWLEKFCKKLGKKDENIIQSNVILSDFAGEVCDVQGEVVCQHHYWLEDI